MWRQGIPDRVCSKLQEPRMEGLKLSMGKKTDTSREESGGVSRVLVEQGFYRGEEAKLCLEDYGVDIEIELKPGKGMARFAF